MPTIEIGRGYDLETAIRDHDPATTFRLDSGDYKLPAMNLWNRKLEGSGADVTRIIAEGPLSPGFGFRARDIMFIGKKLFNMDNSSRSVWWDCAFRPYLDAKFDGHGKGWEDVTGQAGICLFGTEAGNRDDSYQPVFIRGEFGMFETCVLIPDFKKGGGHTKWIFQDCSWDACRKAFKVARTKGFAIRSGLIQLAECGLDLETSNNWTVEDLHFERGRDDIVASANCWCNEFRRVEAEPHRVRIAVLAKQDNRITYRKNKTLQADQ